MGGSRTARLLVVGLLAALTACPATSQQGKDGVGRPPEDGPAVLYAITAPDAPARIETFDVASGDRRLVATDDRQQFGELVGGNPTADEERAYGAWVGSPRGRWVAHITARRLRVAPADDPLRLRTIARARGKGSLGGAALLIPSRSSVLWSADEESLFYLESIPGPDPPPNTIGFPAGTRLYQVRTDGAAPNLVIRSQRPFLNLVGFDRRRNIVYWVETGGGGGISNLTAVALDDGITRIVDELPPGLPSTWLSVTRAADRAFFIRDGRKIVEIKLPHGRARVVYEGMRGEGRVQGLDVAPDGKSIVFERRSEREDVMSAFLLPLVDGRANTIYEGKGDEPRPQMWSPDGRYLMLFGEGSCTRSAELAVLRILDVRTTEAASIEAPEASCRGRTHLGGRGSPKLAFLAWLAS